MSQKPSSKSILKQKQNVFETVRVKDTDIKDKNRIVVLRDVCSDGTADTKPAEKFSNSLGTPSLCSANIFRNYADKIDTQPVPKLTLKELKAEEKKIGEQVSKKLNFKFNDRIYKDLVALNAEIHLGKVRRQGKSKNKVVVRKDIEPNLNDFYEDEEKSDEMLPILIKQPSLKLKPRNNCEMIRKKIVLYEP